MSVSSRVLEILQGMFPEGAVLHEPFFDGREWGYVKECIDTGWVSSVGSFVDRFEEEIAEFCGVNHCVASVNGTSALHVCLMLAGVERGDEVLMPALTFAATANAAAYIGAIPHFIDSSLTTLGVDPFRLDAYLSEILDERDGFSFNIRTGRRVKACVAVHIYGHPVDIDPLVAVCRRYNLVFIEDAAESLGSLYKGRQTGQFGDLAAVSFNGNKILTTGGGGAILTNDKEKALLAKHLTTTAKVPHRWDFVHDHVGYNYRMPNINAALGCAQLEQLPDFIEKKRMLAERYRKAFDGVSGVSYFSEPHFARSNYWLNVLMLERENAGELTDLLRITNESGIMTRPAWRLLNRLDMYKDSPHMNLDCAKDIESRLINLPSGRGLAE